MKKRVVVFLSVMLMGCTFNETKKQETQTVDVYGANTWEEEDKTPEPLEQELHARPNMNTTLAFLKQNDCADKDDVEFARCYEKTRLRMLQIAKALDDSEIRVYMAKRFIGTPHHKPQK